MNRLKTLKTLSFCTLLLLLISTHSDAANRYWAGTVSNKNWNTTANWSTTSGGSGGASIPGANDTAVFDGGDTVQCIINATISVYKFTVKSTYPGVIQQNGNILVVGAGGYKQDAGTFLCTNAAFFMQGAFTLNGGIFISTTGQLRVQGNFTINSPGNFVHNNGIVMFTGIFTIKAVVTLYDCQFYAGGGGGIFTIDPTTVLTIDHVLAQGGVINGTGIINAHGDMNQSGGGAITSGGTATITINGPADQTFTGGTLANNVNNATCHINISKPSGTTLFLSGIITVGGNWTNNNTALNVGSSTLIFFGSKTITESNVLNNVLIYSPGIATTTTIATPTLKVAGDLSIAGSGQTITGGDIEARGNIIGLTYTGVGMTSGSSSIIINGEGEQLFTGTTAAGAGTLRNIKINKTQGTLKLNGNISISGPWTWLSGAVDITSYSSTISCMASTVITGNQSFKNVLFYAASGATVNFNIDPASTLTVTGDISIQAVGTGRVNINGGIIESKGNINLVPGNNLLNGIGGGTALLKINGGYDQTITGTSTLQSQALLPNVEINKTSGNLNLSGFITAGSNWTCTAGAGNMIPGTSTLAFVGGGTITGSQPVYDLLFAPPISGANVFTIASGTTVSVGRNLSISGVGGTVINTGTINVAKDVTVSSISTLSGGSGLININGSTNQTLTGSGTAGGGRLCNVSIAKTGGALTLASTISVSGSWSYNTTSGGTIDAANSTVAFYDGPRTISGTHSLYNVSFYGTIANAVNTIPDVLSVDGELKFLGNYPISINTGAINAKGNITITNTVSGGGGSGTINITGNGNQLITGNSLQNTGLLSNVVINKTGGTATFAGIISVAGNWSWQSGNTDYATNSSMISFSVGTRTISGNNIFYNLSFNPNTTQNSINTIPVTDILTVEGTLNIQGNYGVVLSTGTINLKGNLVTTNKGLINGFDALINVCGTGDQTITGLDLAPGSSGRLGPVRIDKPSGTLFLVNVICVQYSWTYVRGNVDAGTSTVVPVVQNVSCESVNGHMSFYNYAITNGVGTINLLTDLYVKNDLTMGSSTILNANGKTIYLGRNWVATSGTFTHANGTIVLNGTGNQTLSTAATYTINLYNLTVNKPSGKVYSNSIFYFVNNLSLTKGIVAAKINSINLLDNAIVTGASNQSYVAGPFRKLGNDAFTFPLGDTTLPDTSAYHPYSITAPSATGDSYTAQYYAHNQLTDHPTFTPIVTTLKSFSTCEYWSLTRNTGTSVVTPTIGWNSNVCNMGALSNMRVASWDGTQWKNLGQTTTTGNSAVGSIKAGSAGPSTANQYYAIAEFDPTAVPNHLYWIGNGSNKNWDVPSNWSATSGGPSGTVVPTTTDTVHFDGGGKGRLILNTNINVAKLTIDSTYNTDTIIQNDKTITIGGGGMILKGGTFWGGTANITDNGVFTLAGTNFRSTSARLTIVGNYSFTNGNFLHNNGKTYFTTTNTIAGNPVFYDLVFSPVVFCIHSIPATNVLTVMGELKIEGTSSVSINTGTINAKGNVTVSNPYPAGGGTLISTCLINICGTGDQTFAGPGVVKTGVLGNVTIDKTGGTLYLKNIITICGDFNHLQGAVDAGTSTLCFNQKIYKGNFQYPYNNVSIWGVGILNSALDIKGTLKIFTSSVLYANGNQMSIGGNLDDGNAGILGTSTVTFNGTGNQTITKSGGAGTETFYGLEINKPSGKVYLKSPINLSSALTLTKGVLVSTATNTLNIIDNATSTAGSYLSYVAGPLKKTGNDAFTFPLSDTTLTDSSSYHPFSITAPSATTDAFTAQYYAHNQLTDHSTFISYASTLKPVSTCEYWSLTHNAGASTVTPTVSWNANTCNINALADARVGSWSGTTWADLGQNSTTGNQLTGAVKANTAGPSLANQYYVLAERMPTPIANQRYWIGNGSNKSWNNTANWAVVSAGPGGNPVPTPNDTVFFDGGGKGESDIDVNVSVAKLLVKSTYNTNAIVQGAYTITVGTGGMILNGGSFTGGSAAIINNGSFALGGTSFSSTSSTFTIFGSYTKTAGSFLHNNGKIILKTGTTISGSSDFYSLELSPTGDAVYTLTSSDVLNVMGEFKLSGSPLININSGTIHAQGDVTLANTNVDILGSYTLIIDGSGNQTINGAAAKWQSALNNVVITKTTGTVILKDYINVRGNWTNTNGTTTDVSNPSTVVFNGGSKTISGNTTFKNLDFNSDATTDGIYTIPSSDVLTTEGELKFEGGRALYLNGKINAKGDIVAFHGSGSLVEGGTGTITICGTGNQLFSGYDAPKASRLCNIVIDKISGTLTLDRYLTPGHDWTYVKGTMNPGTSTMYFTNSGGNKRISGKNKFNDVVFYGDLYQKDTTTVVDTMTVSGELKYSLKGMTINGGTIVAKGNITINSMDDVIPGSYSLLITGTNDQLLTGTSSLQARAALNNVVINKTGGLLSLKDKICVMGNWIYKQGNLDAKTNLSTLILRDGNRIFSGNHTLYNLTLLGYDYNVPSISEIPAGDVITVEGEFRLDGGYPAYLNTGTINATGSIRSTSYATATTGGTATLNICGTTDQSMSGVSNGGGRFCNIKVNKPSGTLSLSGNLTVGASNWTYVQGAVDPGTSKLVFWGDGTVKTVNGASSMEFYSFEVQNGSVEMQSPIIARKNFMTWGSTTLTSNSHDIFVGGYFQIGGIYNQGTSTITFNGTGRQDEYTSTNTSYYKVVINKPSGSIYVDGSFVINNNLNLIKGALVPKSANNIGHTVKFLDNATVTGGSNASYMMCAVTKVGDDAFTFPLGDTTLSDSARYHPLSIPAPASVTSSFLAQYIAKDPLADNPTFTGIQAPLKSVSSCEYWLLGRMAGSELTTPTLSWNSNNCNISSLADMRVASWDGANWTDLGNSATTGNTTKGTIKAGVQSPNITYQYYTIGNTTDANEIKPISSFNTGNVRTLPPTVEWTKNYGGSNYEEIRDVMATADGGYIFAASTYSSASGDVTSISKGSLDYWIVKLNGTGDVQWSKNVGSAGADAVYGMVSDADGGCTVIGAASSGSGDFPIAGVGSDIGLAKLDGNGNLVWTKLIGGDGADWGYHLKHTTDGGLLVLGLSTSTSGSNGIPDANNGDWDGVILKTDKLGNIQWRKIFGSAGYDFISDAVELPTGEIVVSGVLSTVHGEDYLIAKLSSTGTLIWQKTYGGSGDDDANAISKVQGGFVLTGYTYSTDGDVGPGNGGRNAWTIKTDDNGDLIWKSVFGGNGEENSNAQVGTTDGGSISGGSTASTDNGLHAVNGSRDAMIVKYNGSGTVEWHQEYGTAANERIYGMSPSLDGGYVYASAYESPNSNEVLPGRGSADILISKLSALPLTACVNSSITFSNTSVNATAYQWKVNNVSAGTSSDLTYTFTTAGTYTVSLTASNGSLSSTKNSIVMISGGVTASAGPAVSTSAGSGITIGGTPTAIGGIAPYGYLWTPVTGLSSATIANPISSISATTSYTVSVSDASGCTASASVQVTIEDYKSYGELKKAVDAGYYQVNTSDHMLYFKYTEEYKSGNLTFKIYDSHHDLKSCTNVINKQYGDNRIGIDLIGCLGASTSTYYLLEVTNDKLEKLLLKFKY